MHCLYPYEYVYFNGFVGKLNGAVGKFETEYWGRSFMESAKWINANYEYFGGIPVHSCVSHLSKPYLNKKVIIANKPDNKPFIYICFTRLGKNNVYEGDILYEVKRNNVVFSQIKLIR